MGLGTPEPCGGIQTLCGSCSLRPGPLDCCAHCAVVPPGVLKARGAQHPHLCALLRIRAALPPRWVSVPGPGWDTLSTMCLGRLCWPSGGQRWSCVGSK